MLVELSGLEGIDFDRKFKSWAKQLILVLNGQYIRKVFFLQYFFRLSLDPITCAIEIASWNDLA